MPRVCRIEQHKANMFLESLSSPQHRLRTAYCAEEEEEGEEAKEEQEMVFEEPEMHPQSRRGGRGGSRRARRTMGGGGGRWAGRYSDYGSVSEMA